MSSTDQSSEAERAEGDLDEQGVTTHVASVPGAISHPQMLDAAPPASAAPVLWGAILSPPDFTNSTKDDVVNAYATLLAQYNDLSTRYSTMLTLAQNKDWGFVNEERKNQLEAAIVQIGGLLVQADPVHAIEIAGRIIGIINQVMPGILPTLTGTPLAGP